jgi:ABC-type sugar transport system substrate-binding protein
MIRIKDKAVRAAVAVIAAFALTGVAAPRPAAAKEIVYLTANLQVDFWRYLGKGIGAVVTKAGYDYNVLDSNESAATQLKNAQDAIARHVDGIVISPTETSTAPSVLTLAQKAGIPVVIADIGTSSGEYVSFVISDNREGAYGTGQALAAQMKAKGWTGGTYGIVAVSQARVNGQKRTAGFRAAMAEAGIKEIGSLQQMKAYTADETRKFVQDMLTANPDLRGLFVQTAGPALGALSALKAAHRADQVALVAFDGVPEFVDLMKKGELIASGMQQPYLMGEKAAEALVEKLNGGTPAKEILVPIKVVSSTNIDEVLPTIKETVFANEMK